MSPDRQPIDDCGRFRWGLAVADGHVVASRHTPGMASLYLTTETGLAFEAGASAGGLDPQGVVTRYCRRSDTEASLEDLLTRVREALSGGPTAAGSDETLVADGGVCLPADDPVGIPDECQLCPLLDYRGEETNEPTHSTEVGNAEGGSKIVYHCKRCGEETFTSNLLTDPLEPRLVTDGGTDVEETDREIVAEIAKARIDDDASHLQSGGGEEDLGYVDYSFAEAKEAVERFADMAADDTERHTQSMPASRLAAELGHFTNVRLADVQFPNRIQVKVTDDGLCRSELKTIREFGWAVSGLSIRSNSVSIVRNDRSLPTKTGRQERDSR